jgi:CheY-like chemotaxis protein
MNAQRIPARRVLVVDDEDVVLRVVSTLLEHEGYDVISACNGTDALELLKTISGTIDVAILDVVMPKISGPALFLRLREQFPNMQPLFISGYSRGGIVEEYGDMLQSGEVLEKPFTSEKLLLRVKRAIANSPLP